jgi:hypothetical protein
LLKQFGPSSQPIVGMSTLPPGQVPQIVPWSQAPPLIAISSRLEMHSLLSFNNLKFFFFIIKNLKIIISSSLKHNVLPIEVLIIDSERITA